MQTDSARQARAPHPIEPSRLYGIVQSQRNCPEDTVLFRLAEQHFRALQRRLVERERVSPER